MLQRIQSVYLFVGAALLGIAFFFPMLSFTDNNQIFIEVFLKGIRDYSSPAVGLSNNILLGVQLVTAVIVILSLWCIFQYKNRKLQLKLIRFLIGLLLIDIALVFFQLGSSIGKATGTEANFNHAPVYLMLASLVLFVLAFRGVRSDEEKVRAADRLR